MYTGRVACCPLVSRGGYANRTDRQTDGETDGCQLHLRFPQWMRLEVRSVVPKLFAALTLFAFIFVYQNVIPHFHDRPTQKMHYK